MDGKKTRTKPSRRPPTITKPLHRFPSKFVKDCGFIPIVLINTAEFVERNIKTKEIFQTQGTCSKAFANLNQLSVGRFARSRKNPMTVHDVVEAMKLVLVSLPEALVPEDVCDELITASRENSAHQYRRILSQYRKKSPLNFGILHFMMTLLRKVSQFSDYNQMDVRKLATIFVLDVIKPLKLDDPNNCEFLSERLQRLPYLIMVVEKLILNTDIFTAARDRKQDITKFTLKESSDAPLTTQVEPLTTASPAHIVSDGHIDHSAHTSRYTLKFCPEPESRPDPTAISKQQNYSNTNSSLMGQNLEGSEGDPNRKPWEHLELRKMFLNVDNIPYTNQTRVKKPRLTSRGSFKAPRPANNGNSGYAETDGLFPLPRTNEAFRRRAAAAATNLANEVRSKPKKGVIMLISPRHSPPNCKAANYGLPGDRRYKSGAGRSLVKETRRAQSRPRAGSLPLGEKCNKPIGSFYQRARTTSCPTAVSKKKSSVRSKAGSFRSGDPIKWVPVEEKRRALSTGSVRISGPTGGRGTRAPRSASAGTKRKLKGNSVKKKNGEASRSDMSKSSAMTLNRCSLKMAFCADESMTPWVDDNGSSEDISLIKRTIRNPRVLPVTPECITDTQLPTVEQPHPQLPRQTKLDTTYQYQRTRSRLVRASRGPKCPALGSTHVYKGSPALGSTHVYRGNLSAYGSDGREYLFKVIEPATVLLSEMSSVADSTFTSGGKSASPVRYSATKRSVFPLYKAGTKDRCALKSPMTTNFSSPSECSEACHQSLSGGSRERLRLKDKTRHIDKDKRDKEKSEKSPRVSNTSPPRLPAIEGETNKKKSSNKIPSVSPLVPKPLKAKEAFPKRRTPSLLTKSMGAEITYRQAEVTTHPTCRSSIEVSARPGGNKLVPPLKNEEEDCKQNFQRFRELYANLQHRQCQTQLANVSERTGGIKGSSETSLVASTSSNQQKPNKKSMPAHPNHYKRLLRPTTSGMFQPQPGTHLTDGGFCRKRRLNKGLVFIVAAIPALALCILIKSMWGPKPPADDF